MPTVKEIYLGDLRVECEHCASGTKIITDAPVDNRGKGEAFSPTDLCATALGSCILTIMGMVANDRGIDITGATAEVNKYMSASPRRICKIEIVFTMPARAYSDEDKAALEAASQSCPMCLTLPAETEQAITYRWQD